MVPTRSLDRTQARRIALQAQGYGNRDRTKPVNRGHLRRLMRKKLLIQLDSVPVIIRTQYLPAFSRLGFYDRSLLDDLAYRRDEWIEAFAHEACLHPVEDEPLLRLFKHRAERGETWGNLAKMAQRDPTYVQQVLEQVAERPLKASDLSDPRARSGEWWGSRSLGSLALDWLFRTGRVGIRRVGNFEKVYDLTERIVPAEILCQKTPDETEAMAELLVRSARAHGLGTADCLVDYYRLPKRPAKAILPELVEDGRLIQCVVEGTDKPVFMHPEAVLPRTIETHALLSPFDPIVWNRPRASWLFDFEYRIEIYVPKAKRKYGYYVLPFLLDDELVARCDLKTDRAASTLRLLGAFPEPRFKAHEIAEPLAEELLRLAKFVGVDGVTVDARGGLATAVRLQLAK